MLTVGSLALAPWEVEGLRRSLAPVLTFTRRYHRQPHCLATLPTEIGARVESFVENELSLPAYIRVQGSERVIRLNQNLVDTPLAPVAVVHECSHHILGHAHGSCTAKLDSRRERDVWLASALVAVSRELAAAIVRGHVTVSEVSERCGVPESLVMIRVALLFVLGERSGHLGQAIDTIRYWLGRLESWIDSVKAWRRSRAVSA